MRWFLLFGALRPVAAAAGEPPQRELDAGAPELCSAVDNSTTLQELGVEVLSTVFGRRPTAWKETRLAAILASTDEDSYGEITRLHLRFGESEPDERVVVKRFVPKPGGEVGADAVSAAEHARHLGAFVVESEFYSRLSRRLTEAGLAAPQVLHSTKAELGKPFTMVLEDLTGAFPRGANAEVRRMHPREMRAALRWLAGFHALFWESGRAQERHDLWARGTYWTLDELGTLQLSGVPEAYANRYITNEEWRRLRGAAKAIDRRLAGLPASRPEDSDVQETHRTLVHGDAKPENILCSHLAASGRVRCAGLDFSWVGEGYGMYDVMYLLWSELAQNSVDRYLEEYHAELRRLLPGSAGAGYTVEVMRQHFELCVLDFIRWWAGYKDGSHFWAMPWAVRTMRDVLDRLDGGDLLPEPGYAEAVDREFPLH